MQSAKATARGVALGEGIHLRRARCLLRLLHLLRSHSCLLLTLNLIRSWNLEHRIYCCCFEVETGWTLLPVVRYKVPEGRVMMMMIAVPMIQ